jgi:site-specific DNA-cytosine methylase
MFRIIKAFKPRFVIGENVRGIVNIQDGVVFETVCTNLEDEGYEVQPFNIPAAAVGAPHRRERIWFIAVREEPMVDSDNIRFEQHNETTETTSRRGTSATSQSTSNVGNSEYNGSPTSEIRRGNEKINGGTEERQNNSFEFERTSRSEDNGNVSENVADTENGRGQPSQSERWQGTERGSIDSRGIEREGQDLSPTTDRINVADTHDEGLRTRIGGSDNDHETESRIGGADGEGGSSDVERNNSTSTKVEGMDVADTESIGSDVGRRSEHSETWNGQREIGGENSQDDANSNEEGLQGFRQSRNQLNKRFSLRSEGSEGEHGTVGEGWWSVEPNVGRVAHGVPGRVYRLKGLGNSIVPQIVEEIGKALIKATRES